MGNLNSNLLVDSVSETDRKRGVVNRRDLPNSAVNFRVVHVFVLDQEGRLLLQHIAPGERSAGLWGSSVAGYVAAGERYDAAAIRKLRDELGVSTRLKRIGKWHMPDLGGEKFITAYWTQSSGPFAIDHKQAVEVKFERIGEIEASLRSDPERFTATFRFIFPRVSGALKW